MKLYSEYVTQLIVWMPIFLLLLALIYLLCACTTVQDEEALDFAEHVMWQPKGAYATT